MRRVKAFLRPAFAVGLLSFGFSTPGYAESAVTQSAQVRNEVNTALEEVQRSLLNNLVSSAEIGKGKCKPQLSWSFMGITMNFTRTATCNLQGRLSLYFVPLRAEIDLDVFNLKTVESMKFRTAVILRSVPGGGMQVGFQFLDGQIDLRLAPGMPLSSMTVNGRVMATFMKGNFMFESRKNIFDASGGGFALVTELVKTPKSQRFEVCALTGGEGGDVDAGELDQCKAIGQPKL